MFAVDVVNLDKRFHHRRHGRRGESAGADGRVVHDRPRRVRRDPRSERIGEVDARADRSRRCCCRTVAARASSATTSVRDARGAPSRQPRVGRGVVLQADVGVREPRLRGAFLRLHARRRRASGSPRSSSGSASRSRATRRADGGPRRAECSRRWRSRGRCSPLRCCCCSTSRRPGSTRARSARYRSSSARSAPTHDTTILLCTHDLAEAEALAERVGILHAGRAARARAGRRADCALRRVDARGRVLHRDRDRIRGRRRGGKRMMFRLPSTTRPVALARGTS